MGTAILRGISTGLLVTLLTLFGGLIWETMGLGGLKVTSIVDIGLFLSSLIGGYRAARDGGHWVAGAAAGAGYVVVSTLLLALFAPVSGAGVVQLLAEGALLGGLGGVIGGGISGGMKVKPVRNNKGWRAEKADARYGAYREEEYLYMDDDYTGKKYDYPGETYDYEVKINNDQGRAGRDADRLQTVEQDETMDYFYPEKEMEEKYNSSNDHPWWEEEIGGIKRIG